MNMKAIGIGGGVADMLVNIDKLPTYNQGARLLMQSYQYGGKVPSGMAALGRLGVPCAMIGVVGDDSLGHAQLRDYQRNGVDVSQMVVDPEGTTPLCMVLSDREGSRNILYNGMRCRPLTVADLDESFIKSAQALLLSSYGEPEIQAAKWIHEVGGKVAFDADGYSEKIEAMIPYTDAFIPSEFYYESRYHGVSHREALADIVSRGAETAIITLGDKGLVGLSKGEYFELPAHKVSVVDTTGAGDVFHGSFLYGLLAGWDAKECARLSSGVSAIKCMSIGGRAGLPTYDVVRRYVDTGEIDLAWMKEREAFYSQSYDAQQ
ncbi:MAG: carbohydrate kinase family protein [Oscillospiraceae bacterium]|nr:carbohydrate kinase family protein [Oscillospiraceae bacterium]